MGWTIEPSIAVKIGCMKERVRWRHPAITSRQIDQTRLVFDSGLDADAAFAFLVLGDSGTGRHRRQRPQRQVAELMLRHGQGASFILHTGDVVYQVGSSEQYRNNFIVPYREWLVDGDHPDRIAYDRMIFNTPFFPVLGNHDYYDLPPPLGLLSGLTAPLRQLLSPLLDLDVGWHGSRRGEAYACAFLDVLQHLPESELGNHLDQCYASELDGERCLSYRPSRFTRLPNRYYSFRVAGLDVFALDSNTFNQPLAGPRSDPAAGQAELGALRQRLILERTRLRLSLGGSWTASLDPDDQGDRADDLAGELEAIEEQLNDIEKQLDRDEAAQTVDHEQLGWLKDRLVASWRNPAVRGRVLVLHHPPYVTEATKWFQGQTLAVRHRLRQVLDQVAAELGPDDRDPRQPLLSLVLMGHAHCLEVLRTGATGHGDAHIPWVICGGSGYSLRRQRPEGADLGGSVGGQPATLARSELFVGRSGQGARLRRPYSALRVEVGTGRPLRLRLIPLVTERLNKQWQQTQLAPILLC
ncbi:MULTISPECIES: metallophosphoesterase [unclassified Synechococcus]|uniref:metallophosphoesterase family protein n=1 Tax=unclassified Synechococcus TaxID=2626047 RepID=UPI0021A86760|nr:MULTISPECIES: metallophosphoesterase [unclassified Synechococcus]MCT0213159.1 metallophosphoesterase [Synechococcus sp. CS-1326]MCT0233047.1 metallophosphoesterase [Synechococcus sp. CS-1327]